MIRKSVKSVQNAVNEAMSGLDLPLITASAYSQARYKLKHTAFIALNQTAIVETVYRDDDYHKFWGFRVLAIDGSKIVLPNKRMSVTPLVPLLIPMVRTVKYKVNTRMH